MILQPRVDETAPGQPLRVAPILDAVGVGHRFRNGRGVGPVDLCIAPGERTALMGANGAGKTTLLRILATSTRPRRGIVRWCGTARPRDGRRWIGFAPDAVLDDPGLTGRQATYFWCRQWARENTGDLVEDALRRFGLAAVADEPIAGYSFGMRRRLALAQALAHEPRLALLDEPTAGLDAEGISGLGEELMNRARRGSATLVASNDCAFVAEACDRVIFLDGGTVLADATPEQLLAGVGTARRVELDIDSTTEPRMDDLSVLLGIDNAAYARGVVTVDLLDDAALAAVVRVVDGWPGGVRAVRIRRPDLSDAFSQLTGSAFNAGVSPR
ncbi:MAG: ABC transporter ATP-binding protein [Candidatus Dormiibacterota bacterium]